MLLPLDDGSSEGRQAEFTLTWWRAQMVLLSAQGMPVARIAEVTFTSDDRVRDVIHTADGRLDPCGLVKGWAVERAADLLHEAGAHDLCVNGGGDLQLRGEAAPGTPWRVGVADPARPGRLLTVVTGTDGGPWAVATSGTAERGHHILDPHTGRPAHGLLSATVVGPSLTWADVYATAVFARGTTTEGQGPMVMDGYAVFTVTDDGRAGDPARSPGGPYPPPPGASTTSTSPAHT